MRWNAHQRPNLVRDSTRPEAERRKGSATRRSCRSLAAIAKRRAPKRESAKCFGEAVGPEPSLRTHVRVVVLGSLARLVFVLIGFTAAWT